MKEFNFNLKSMIITVGSSNCGKTHFCKTKLSALERGGQFNVQYLSSDDIRKELLGGNTFNSNISRHKFDDDMLYASDPAFKLLETKAQIAMQFPIIADFVIIDATNISEETSNRFQDLAIKNNYSFYVLNFNYDNREDYFKFIDDGDVRAKSITGRHVKKLKEAQRYISQMKRKGDTTVYQIKSNDFNNISISINKEHEEMHYKSLLRNDSDIIVVGDIHGCYGKFIELLGLNQLSVEDGIIVNKTPYHKTLVINGDFIDKGSDIIKVVNFIYDNITSLQQPNLEIKVGGC